MNLEDVINILDQQFVDDYDHMLKFMNEINLTLEKMNIDSRYNYNDFCIDIKNKVIELVNYEKIDVIKPEFLSKTLNIMIKTKILDDPDYKEKLQTFFENIDIDIVTDIEKLKK